MKLHSFPLSSNLGKKILYVTLISAYYIYFISQMLTLSTILLILSVLLMSLPTFTQSTPQEIAYAIQNDIYSQQVKNNHNLRRAPTAPQSNCLEGFFWS